MKIKTKLKVNTMVSVGVVLIVGIILLWASQQVKDSIRKNKTAGQFVKGVFDLNIITNDYLLHREKRARRQWQLKHDSLTQLITDEQFQKIGEPHILKKIQQYHESLKKIFSQLITRYESRSKNRQQAKVALEERLISQLLMKSQTMVSSARQLAQSSQIEVVKAQQNASWIVIFLVIMIVTLVVTSSWAIGRGVMTPIAKLKEGATMVGSGNLDYQIDITTNDEIGELSRTFNQMTKKLSQSIAELQQEIAERKRAEKALRESEKKYRGLFNDALDMIHIVDQNGRIIGANPIVLEIMGYTKQEYHGKPLFETVHPDYRAASKTAFETALKGEKVKAFETALITKNGEKVDVEVNAVPQKEGKKIVAVRAIIRDIRERKRAEEELAKHREHLEELVRDRTAELQSIVNSMAGREVRMAELKETIKKLRAQLEEAGMTPVADDPLLGSSDK